jgi:hypothetical protein
VPALWFSALSAGGGEVVSEPAAQGKVNMPI